jgi:hypothetical protein
MIRPGQFTLSQLLTEVLLIAVTIGVIRLIVDFADEPPPYRAVVLLIFAVPVLVGAAIGTPFGKLASGACWGGVVSLVVFFLAPAVMSPL